MNLKTLLENAAPLPYHLVGSRNLGYTIHASLPDGSDSDALAFLTTQLNREANEATARLLVHAVNLLPKVTEALARAARFIEVWKFDLNPHGDLQRGDVPDFDAACDQLGFFEAVLGEVHAEAGDSSFPTAPEKPRSLPPDPDRQNQDRADWAATALRAFRAETNTDVEDVVSDLLTDLHHYCDFHGLDFETELTRSRTHYRAETTGVGEAV